MLVKGIKDTLLEEKTRFSIVEDDQKNSDFYLEGYIEEYGQRDILLIYRWTVRFGYGKPEKKYFYSKPLS